MCVCFYFNHITATTLCCCSVGLLDIHHQRIYSYHILTNACEWCVWENSYSFVCVCKFVCIKSYCVKCYLVGLLVCMYICFVVVFILQMLPKEIDNTDALFVVVILSAVVVVIFVVHTVDDKMSEHWLQFFDFCLNK